MKNKVITAIGLLVVGFLAGFVPQYSKVHQAERDNQDLKTQLDGSRRAEALCSFRNRAALLYFEAARSNFAEASQRASKQFTDLREFANQTPDPARKQSLEDILNSRDSIIAGLAKADPAVTSQIQDMFMKLQQLQP